MSVIEQARRRMAELKARRLPEALPKIREIRLLGQVPMPMIDEIRAKGVVGVIQERFPMVRGAGILGAVTPTSQKPGIVEDIYIEPLKGERSRNLSVQM